MVAHRHVCLALLLLVSLSVMNTCSAMSHGKPKEGGKETKPPVAEKPKQEAKLPTDCASLTCLNGGRCVVGGSMNYPMCNCTGTAYTGKKCGLTSAQEQALNAEAGSKQASAAKAGKAQQQLAEDKKKCTDLAKQMLCPKETSKNGQCVGAIAECFADESAMKAYKTAKDGKCGAGEKYCDQEGICLGKGASCAPADKCPATKPFRCPSWACAEDDAKCADVTEPPKCAAGEQRCPDGLCYPGTGGLKECAKLGVQWDGCPPGKMECARGKSGTCAENEDKCQEKVGCASPLVPCGFKRDAATGKPVFNETTGKPLPDCKEKAQCTLGTDRPPKPTTKPLDPSTAGSLEAQSADGKPAMKLKMRKGSFTVGGVEKAVNFSIADVPDSLAQEGAFGTLFESGALLGSLISIEPSTEVEIVGGLTLDISVLDASANENAAKCALVLANTQMLSIKDITNVTEVPTSMGTCAMGEIGTCSCAVNVTHFSTYGVVDATVAYEARTVVVPDTNNTNSTLSSAQRVAASSPTHSFLTAAAALLVVVATHF